MKNVRVSFKHLFSQRVAKELTPDKQFEEELE